jgi:dihydroorotate dehydrogenase electron transfer subunit
MKQFKYVEVVDNIQISKQGIFQLVINDTQSILPGQFYNLYIDDKSLLLPRPVSVSESTQNLTKFVYRVVGKGTEKLTQLKTGNKIKVLGPLGNGFSLPDYKAPSIVIGGGVGIAPLLELTKQIKGEKYVYLGFDESPFLVDEFTKYSTNFYCSTMSGKDGFHGNVIELLKNYPMEAKFVYACGPKKMLERLVQEMKTKAVKIQVSMEERMGCGIGACLGCAIKIKKSDQEEWKYLRVCKDGPVFDGSEVIWNE